MGLSGADAERTIRLFLQDTDPGVREAWGITQRVAWLEVRLDRLLELPHGERAYSQVSTQPSSDIDLAFVVDESIQASAIEDTIRSAAGSELASVGLFDVFRGGQLAAGTRSLAFALRLQSADHTLDESEIGAIRQRCIDAVESAHGASLRG